MYHFRYLPREESTQLVLRFSVQRRIQRSRLLFGIPCLHKHFYARFLVLRFALHASLAQSCASRTANEESLMSNVKCVRCGVVNVVSDEVCKVCGAELTPPLQQPPRYIYQELRADGDDQPANVVLSIRPFDGVGDVLGPTLSLFTKNLWLITKIVVVIVAPFEVFKVMSLGNTADDWQLNFGVYVLELVCKVLIAPALIYALMRVIQTGVAPGVNESYRWGLSKLGKVCICAFMSGLLQTIGFLFLIIPGIIIGLSLELVYPVAVLENRSASGVLRRSYELTKGHRWKILGASIIIALLVAVISAPAYVTATFLMGSEVFWPINVAALIVADIAQQITTVLSLVIYLSILRTLE